MVLSAMEEYNVETIVNQSPYYKSLSIRPDAGNGATFEDYCVWVGNNGTPTFFKIIRKWFVMENVDGNIDTKSR